VLAASACGRSSPESRIIGWPPDEPVVALRDAVEAPAPDVSPAEVSDPDGTAEVDARSPLGPCEELVELGCELWTPFADACREARKSVPDDTHPATREVCAELVARYRKDELPRLKNPCGRLARAICKEAGAASERCKAANARIPLLTDKREWRHCLGELLWFEAKSLRR
jgi:hypothetical protein